MSNVSRSSTPISEVFIVDNSDSEWKVRNFISGWCSLSETLDIATGYFEIGALLSLGEEWKSLDKIRILLGDEVSYRTQRAFAEGLKRVNSRLDTSIEGEKVKNDFLTGVEAIVEAMRSGKIECKVYRKDKFHAKCYITHPRNKVLSPFAIVGSSNFTAPGLTDNVELNVRIVSPTELPLLQDWFETHWNDAENVTPDILRVLTRHTDTHTPFEIWFKALDELFRGEALTPDLWDANESTMFPKLDKYQQDAYKNLVKIADSYGGAFLCDGVGLGKTYVGLMLLERFVVREKKRVVLFAPKAAREDVWDTEIRHHLSGLNSGFVNFILYNHTDLQRKGKFEADMELTLRDADVVIIDEAHHFRNPGVRGEGALAPSRYRLLQKYLHESGAKKQVFFLTATPINNSIHDFRHMAELFTNDDDKYFSEQLAVHSLRRHFIEIEKELLKKVGEKEQLDLDNGTQIFEAEKLLRMDKVFSSLVVQRSRAYVKQSQLLQGAAEVQFPERQAPQVVPYNLKATYGRLLDSVETAFNKKTPLFVLGVYYPLSYWKGDRESEEFTGMNFEEGRQKQVVILIRTLFLKRFESSARAFEASCLRLLLKLFAWVTVHGESTHQKKRLERWLTKNQKAITNAQERHAELFPSEADEDTVEEILTDEMLADVEKLPSESYDVDAMFDDCLEDLTQLVEFVDLASDVKPEKDDKLKELIKLLKTDSVLKSEKVLIFTEFADTARYIEKEIKNAGIAGVERIDGGSSQAQRSGVIKRFSPYYNGSSSPQIAAEGKQEIRVLISTDVLSEGLNLQDASRLINYDIHWNPVRLMQRIGRVDRRMKPEAELRILQDHPEQLRLRGRVEFWNFLPPDELDELLKLFQRVANKTLVISRTLGIEGSKLLTPDDKFDPIREINQQFDGTLSDREELRLDYNKLLQDYPEEAKKLAGLPLKTFSGKESPAPNTKAVFFCFRIPRPDPSLINGETGEMRWTQEAGQTVWACYDLDGKRTHTDPGAIAKLIKSPPDKPRVCKTDRALLSDIRKKVEQELSVEYLRSFPAPVGVSPFLKCWMELN